MEFILIIVGCTEETLVFIFKKIRQKAFSAAELFHFKNIRKQWHCICEKRKLIPLKKLWNFLKIVTVMMIVTLNLLNLME